MKLCKLELFNLLPCMDEDTLALCQELIQSHTAKWNQAAEEHSPVADLWSHWT